MAVEVEMVEAAALGAPHFPSGLKILQSCGGLMKLHLRRTLSSGGGDSSGGTLSSGGGDSSGGGATASSGGAGESSSTSQDTNGKLLHHQPYCALSHRPAARQIMTSGACG